jgi:hypothetical protein
MTEIRLKWLTKDRSEGLDRYYVRLPGKRKVRIYGVPGSAEFMANYYRALEDHAAPIISRAVPVTSLRGHWAKPFKITWLHDCIWLWAKVVSGLAG